MATRSGSIGNNTSSGTAAAITSGNAVGVRTSAASPAGGAWLYALAAHLANPTAAAHDYAITVYRNNGGAVSTFPRTVYSQKGSIPAGSAGAVRTLTLALPVYLPAGNDYAVVVQDLTDNGNLNIGHSGIGVTSGTIYQADKPTYPAPDPLGTITLDSGSTVPYVIYGDYETNVAPTVPTSLVPAPNAVISGLTPTFSWAHNDANSDVGDKVLGASLMVQRSSDGVTMWAPYLTATSAQQSSGTMSAVYGGSALVPGVTYRWQVRTRDLAGTYGPYSAFQSFTVTQLGTLAMDPATPAAKVEVLSGLTFAATWTHGGGLALTKARARLAIGGSVVWEGAAAGFTPAAGNVANGGTLTFTQALAGMPTLSAGQTYQVAVQGQDTGGVWSPYSPYRTLRTNAPPNTPAALSPNTTQPSTTRPLLTFTAQDPDVAAGFPEADLTASVRLKDGAGTVRFTRAATLVDAAAGMWQYQVTATDEPDLAAGASVSRLWDAQANDGTTTGAFSAQAAYVYASGPVVTITSPGATLTTATGPITWTVVGTQISRTVKIWAGSSATGTPRHTNTATTGSLSYVIPVGVIYNGQTYTIAVEVVDNVSITGSSPTVTTTASFPVPAAVAGASAALVAAAGEPDPSRVAVSWQASVEPPDVFVAYRITRRFASDPTTAAVLLAELVNPSQASLADEHPPTGGDLIYTIAQVTRDANGSELLGAVTEMLVEALDLNATVLVNVVDPTIRVALRFAESVEVVPEKGRLELDTWAGGPALILPTGSRRKVYSATFNVINDLARPDLMTAEATMAMVRALDASDSPVSVRDGRRPRWFALADVTESDRRIGASDVSLTLTEIGVLTEGVGI